MQLTLQEVANRLRVSLRTVHTLTVNRALRAIRTGRAVRVRQGELARFIQHRSTQPKAIL
jgi:excisionase family DNA binding protein